ncbi:MAG: glycosyl transferase family 2 [Gammaproteobacteria bacterium RBG_16_66_13]|nr:MAG: glycosyl transferase family 2 [Gammaproteobacteria bacterium RBG_16_66_13]
MPSSALRDEVLRHIESLGTAEIVVGIPSYNNARTIGHVVRAVTTGLAKYFPDRRAVLVNSDGGSSDGTPDVVASTEAGATKALLLRQSVRPPPRVITPYQGIPGKGSAIRAIFEIATRLDACACAVVDSDLRSITPEWIELLVGPVLHEGFDYVCPLYARHKYDGTITNAIVYPLVRSIYGRRIRQPIGGDFGFSGGLAGHFLTHNVWDSDVARFGVDIWMTTTALVGDFRVCQAHLGSKIHDAKDPGAHLSEMLAQVTGSLFQQLAVHEARWKEVRGSEPVPEFGFHYETGLEPVPVNVPRMVHVFRQGVHELAGLYTALLSPGTLARCETLARGDETDFRMPGDLWVRVVYEYAVAYRWKRLNPEHLLRTLTPLYLARTASWMKEAANYGASEVEGALEELCLDFEALKPAFVEAWREGRFPS